MEKKTKWIVIESELVLRGIQMQDDSTIIVFSNIWHVSSEPITVIQICVDSRYKYLKIVHRHNTKSPFCFPNSVRIKTITTLLTFHVSVLHLNPTVCVFLFFDVIKSGIVKFSSLIPIDYVTKKVLTLKLVAYEILWLIFLFIFTKRRIFSFIGN